MSHDSYLGNHRLKRAGVSHSFSAHEAEEYARCAYDPVYFIENYVKIVHVDHGLVMFKMYEYQKKMVLSFRDNRFTIAKLPRQAGKSVTVVAFFLWLILFHDSQNIGILANKGRLALDLLGRLRLAYENLPMWMQQGITTWNKGNIELENGSKILAAATSSSAVRGGSFTHILLDEFGFLQRNMAEAFFASVYPTISSGKTTKLIVVSTPNGLNHYYKMWTDAVEGRSNYVPIEVNWYDVPGRDQKFKEETIRNTSQQQWDSEFECQFLGSVNTLISSMKLRELAFMTPTIKNIGVHVYEEPAPGNTYCLLADVGHGIGIDYSAFSVIDVTSFPFRQVAKYRKNDVSPLVYPNVICTIARWYNTAAVVVEVNDIGQQVAETLISDLEYGGVLSTIQTARSGQKIGGGFSGRSRPGVRMTEQVKRIGCSNLKDLIEGDKLIIQDFDTIEELSNFVSVGGSYEAEPGNHDDLVMTLVIFGWLATQPYFKDMTNTDLRARMVDGQRQMLEADQLPAGFMDDGSPEGPISLETGRTDPFFIDTSF